MKYKFRSIEQLMETLSRMSWVADNVAATQVGPYLKSFYNGKVAAFNDVIQFLAVSSIDGIPKTE